jgi:hypothetical protein
MFTKSAKSFAEMVGYPAIKASPPMQLNDTHGTTVLALRYDSGILNLGDRRAVMANYVMYDKAEKILAIDDSQKLFGICDMHLSIMPEPNCKT